MTRRERLERKLELRQEWAQKAEVRSDRHYNIGHQMFDAIPMGQPILVGHYSEKRDRNYRNRASNHMSKFVEERKLSEHHEQCAKGIESALDRSIFSDDDNAIEALEARIAEHEAEREKMKAINKFYKKGDIVALGALGIDYEALKAKLAAAGSYWGSAPHLPYELSNLGGRITTDRKRLEFLKKERIAKAEAEAAPNGVTLKECGGGYCVVRFAEKPSREILDSLRNAGYHWSSGSWGGYLEKLPEQVKALLTIAA